MGGYDPRERVRVLAAALIAALVQLALITLNASMNAQIRAD
jgi:hypothetical protein